MTSERSEGVEHLQRAAQELIAAARSFLDSAEDLVEDRVLFGEVVSKVGGLAQDLTGVVARGGFSGGPPFEAESPFEAEPPFESGPPQAGDDPVDLREGGSSTAGSRNQGSASPRVRRIEVE